jgi:N-acetyl sugar amidotransferase
MERIYQQCKHCVLDTHDDPAIVFDERGICNYCLQYELELAKLPTTQDEANIALHKIVDRIKTIGKGKPYDCIMGLSGGVDSTYLAYRAKQLGLRPLAVHFDNGWNSELAVQNIERIVTKLNIDLHTLVVDWDEFRDLQLSFFKASVIDIELATDHAILTTMYKLAIEKNIKFVLSGHNIATELILPVHWYHDKRDHVHIKAIQKEFGTIPLKTYPLMTSFMKFMIEWKQIKSVRLLDYMPYNKKEVKKIIADELGWRDYGGKHYESIFTRFYQGYVLVEKYKVDKRRAHLSNLICSGQMTRDEVLLELKTPPYNPKQFEEDLDFVLKKFGLTKLDFDALMHLEIKRHTDYEVDTSIYKRYGFLKIFLPFWRVIKKVRAKIYPTL